MIIKLNKIKLKQILAVEVGLDEAFIANLIIICSFHSNA